MADFSMNSDSSDEEKAVEELLRQAMDHSVLEQVAAINCSSFTSDSVLPTHLETRFHRLKSLPAAPPKPNLSADKNHLSSSSSFNSHFPSAKSAKPQFRNSLSDDENEDPIGKNGKLGSGSGSSSLKSLNLAGGNAISPPLKENPDGKMGSKSKSRSGSFSSPPDSPNSFMDSPSPPKKTGCFWCSPKRVPRRRSKENPVGGFGVDWGRSDKEFMSDLSMFSEKEQQKILKKAMKEEEKISREAEKIVKWAKQASARMNISDIEDELSESEKPK